MELDVVEYYIEGDEGPEERKLGLASYSEDDTVRACIGAG